MNPRRRAVWIVALVAICAAAVLFSTKEKLVMAQSAGAGSKWLAHMVYFTLKDSTPAGRQKLVDACNKYLGDEPGIVFFAVGTPADYDREVNVRDFDVGLHVVFSDKASHDAYQTAPKHLKFIEENKPSWSKVRVFDCDVTGKAINATSSK